MIAEYSDTYTIVFIYDAAGSPIGMRYRSASFASEVWKTYWYEKNLQGDIVAIYSNDGVKLISYIYDAWGSFTTTYHNGGASTAAAKNPFKYRGYYYDSDLGLYYLRSRYYDPNTGRFISPDNIDVIGATPMDLTDKNLFAYCDNNPVMRVDEDGEFWNYVIGGVVGAIVGGVVAAASGGDVDDIIIGAISGCLSGIVAASGLGWVAQAGICAGISGVADLANQTVDIVTTGGDFSDYDLLHAVGEAALGFATSAAGSGLGFLTGKHVTKTAQMANKAFDAYLGKTFSAGLRAEAGRSTSALLRQAEKFMQKTIFYDNITQGVSSVVGSFVSLWNLGR